MSYVLEDLSEFQRLEKQSQHPSYDYRVELKGLKLQNNMRVLDAGCGSGVVCRYLSELNPTVKITGCDLSNDRVTAARKASLQYKNISYQTNDITQLSFEDQSFDVIIVRYVLQHLSPSARDKAFKELYRVLAPQGQLVLIDTDGLISNLYPLTPFLSEVLPPLVMNSPVDLFIGRKLPSFLVENNFSDVGWEIQTTECKGQTQAASEEIEMMKERLTHAKKALTLLFGSETKATKFIQEYIQTMGQPGAVYFQNKFIVQASKK